MSCSPIVVALCTYSFDIAYQKSFYYFLQICIYSSAFHLNIETNAPSQMKNYLKIVPFKTIMHKGQFFVVEYQAITYSIKADIAL